MVLSRVRRQVVGSAPNGSRVVRGLRSSRAQRLFDDLGTLDVGVQAYFGVGVPHWAEQASLVFHSGINERVCLGSCDPYDGLGRGYGRYVSSDR